MSKYRNVKTISNGLKFDSKKEAARYNHLLTMHKAGLITELQTQVPFQIIVNNTKICKYIADFVYLENGKQVVEDVKGVKTAVYRLKKKLMLAVHNIVIKES